MRTTTTAMIQAGLVLLLPCLSRTDALRSVVGVYRQGTGRIPGASVEGVNCRPGHDKPGRTPKATTSFQLVPGEYRIEIEKDGFKRFSANPSRCGSATV